MLSYIEIAQTNLLHNIRTFKTLLKPGTGLAVVVKANAYGHGMNEVARVVEKEVDFFQVDDLNELREIRKVTTRPVLVLGYVAKAELAEAVQLGGILALYDLERAELLNELGRQARQQVQVHVKIDANLGRQGILPGAAEEFAAELAKYENLEVTGIYSHFANIEDTSDFSHAQKQLESFEKAITSFTKNGCNEIKRHISASSGILVYESGEGTSDLVRMGIALYGMWPSEDLRQKFEKADFQLKPVMRWVSHVAQVKTVPQGYSIGYGLTHVTEKETRIAVIPQGYSDGFDRGLSNCGEVLIKGARCRVLGRVAMNMFVVDVSHLPEVQAEDEVVLLGQQGQEIISAEELAQKLDTINYEITTRVSALLPRVLV